MSMKFDIFLSICQNEVNGHIPTEKKMFENFFSQVQLADELGFVVGVKDDYSDWPILFIDLPEGQVSWHIPANELAGTYQNYRKNWDGHSIDDKRERIDNSISR